MISRKTMTKSFVQMLRMRKKWLQERFSGISSVGNCIQRVVGSDSKFTNYLMKMINGESYWPKTVKKLDSKLQKQQQGWRKISNTARKYNKDENLENYDSEVQMYAPAHSGPRLAN